MARVAPMHTRELHEDAVVVDAHNDLPVLLLMREREFGRDGSQAYWQERWLPEARAGGVDVQVLPVYNSPSDAEASLRKTLLQIEALEREAAKTPDVALCRTGAEIDAALAEGRIALLLALEGTPGVGTDVELFALLHRLGIRMASFTHWARAALADGTADEEAGSRLPAVGVAALRELERLGIILDVSHLAAPAVDHVFELATRTIVASHSSCRALCDHHRNLSDEHLRAIAATGGVTGINVLPFFIDPQKPTLDRVVDHLEHAVEVAGADHVGLGPDFIKQYADEVYASRERYAPLDGFDLKQGIPELAGARDLPNLTERMLARGWAEADVRKVLGENWLRVFRTLL
jgi:membrane dipeptidase